MNRKLALILMAFIMAPSIIAPFVYGATFIGLPGNYVGTVSWLGETGEFSPDSSIFAITRPEFGVITGIAFPSVDIERNELINEAHLTIYTASFQEPGNASITVYGYNEDLDPNFFDDAHDLMTVFLTSSHVNYDIEIVQPWGYISINITNIVQEIVSRPWWDCNDTMAFVIYAEGGQPYKTVRGNHLNHPYRWPILYIKYGEPPEEEEGETYLESYRGYSIYNKTIGEGIPKVWGMNFVNNSVTKDMIFKYEGESWVGAETPFSWFQGISTSSKHIPGDQICIVGETIYALGENSTDSKAYLYRAEDWKNGNWTRLFEICPDTDDLEKSALAYDPGENLLYFFTNEQSNCYYGYYNLTGENHLARTRLYKAWSEIGHGVHAVYDQETGYVYASFGSRLSGGNDPRIRTFRFINSTSYDYKDVDNDFWNPNIGLTNSSLILTYTYGTNLYYSAYDRVNFTVETANTYISSAYSQPSDMIQVGSVAHDLRRDKNTNYLIKDFKFNAMGPTFRLLDGNYLNTSIEMFSGIYLTEDTEGLLIKYTGVDDVFLVEDLELMEGGSDYSPANFWNLRKTGIRCDTVNFMVKNNWLGDVGGEGFVYVVRDENGTVIGEFDNLDDAYAFIDEELGGPDPLDPNPPGQDWGDNPYLDRSAMNRYFLVFGLGFLLIPPIFLAHKPRYDIGLIVIFLMMFGVALLIQLKSI